MGQPPAAQACGLECGFPAPALKPEAATYMQNFLLLKSPQRKVRN